MAPKFPSSVDLTPQQRMDFAKSGRLHPTGEFMALEREWYERLAESGFDDIEPAPWHLKASSFLREHHLATRERAEVGARTGAAELYRLVEHGALTFRFASRTTRLHMGLWLRGWKHSEITRRLPRIRVTPSVASALVRRIAAHSAANQEPADYAEEEATGS